MIALIFDLGPLLLQFGLVFVVAIVLLLVADKVKPAYRIYARFGVLAIGVLAVWGLLQHRERDKHFGWEQEVRLNDGSTMWIKRRTTFGHFGEPTQVSSARSLLEEFEFTHPRTGEIVRWKEQYDLQPLLLDFDQGSPYLATAIKSGKHHSWGCPPHPYAFFRYTNGQWLRIGINLFPARFERSNVFPYLDDSTRRNLDAGVRKMFSGAVEDKFKPPMSEAVRVIDRRIVNPLFFCRGSVDRSYGSGVTKQLQDRYGTNSTPNILNEQEAIELGILRKGDEK